MADAVAAAAKEAKASPYVKKGHSWDPAANKPRSIAHRSARFEQKGAKPVEKTEKVAAKKSNVGLCAVIAIAVVLIGGSIIQTISAMTGKQSA